MNELSCEDCGDTASCHLKSAADISSKWPGKEGASDPVDHESELVLSLELTLVLPWDAFWVSSILSEAISYPGVALEVLLQEIHVCTFLLLRGNRRWSHFECLISLFLELIEFLTVLVVEVGLAEDVVVGVVKLAWHCVCVVGMGASARDGA